jgi:hypothetical protein
VTQRVGTDVAWDAGACRNPEDHPIDVARSIGRPETGRRISGPSVRSPRQTSRARSTGTVIGIVAGLLPLPTRCRTRCPRRVSW